MHIDIFTGDRHALLPLFAQADDSPSQIARYLALGEVLVARDLGSVVGHLQLIGTCEPDVVEIKSLAVIQPRRREGIGARLVESAVAHCRQRRAHRLLVATAAADVGNLSFYQRQGFRMQRVVRDAFGPSNGYPEGLACDGIVLRDQVVLDLELEDRPSVATLRPSDTHVRAATSEDRPTLVSIWLGAVRASHRFLDETEIQALLPEVERYLADPGHDIWAFCHGARPVGFMGLAGSSVESLFIAPEWARRGAGTALLAHARASIGQPLTIDGNEANTDALAFYRASGFSVAGRSPVDDRGRPYPLLHLREDDSWKRSWLRPLPP